jgi:hypothetical protein
MTSHSISDGLAVDAAAAALGKDSSSIEHVGRIGIDPYLYRYIRFPLLSFKIFLRSAANFFTEIEKRLNKMARQPNIQVEERRAGRSNRHEGSFRGETSVNSCPEINGQTPGAKSL